MDECIILSWRCLMLRKHAVGECATLGTGGPGPTAAGHASALWILTDTVTKYRAMDQMWLLWCGWIACAPWVPRSVGGTGPAPPVKKGSMCCAPESVRLPGDTRMSTAALTDRGMSSL